MNPLLFAICILTICIATDSPDTEWASTVHMHYTDKKSRAWKTLQSECNNRQEDVGEQGNNEAILIGRISSGVRLINLCSFCIGGQKGNNMLACIMPLHESMSSNPPISKGYSKPRRNSEPDDRNDSGNSNMGLKGLE